MAAHRAVAALFVLNAAAYANVVPRLAAIKADLGLSNTALGTAVAAMAVGALLSGPAAGALVARVGSARLAVGCGVGFGLVLPGFALASSWGALAATFLVLGLLDSLMDVSMNAHALRVQRGLGRSIINALHGTWSIGAVLGGVAGTLAAGAGVSIGSQLGVAAVVIVAVAFAVRPFLLTGPDEADRPPLDVDGGRPAERRAVRRAVRRHLLLLGLVVVLSAAIEDAPQSWGAVLLREELGAGAGAAGLVFVAFQASMTVSRFAGDRLVERFGEAAVVRAGGLLTAVGVAAGLAVGTAPALVVGFALAGAGTAALFPVAFHAAGQLPGVSTGHGVAVVAWMGRVGFLVAAPLVGLLADAAGLRVGLVLVPVAGLAVAVLAGPAFGRARPTET